LHSAERWRAGKKRSHHQRTPKPAFCWAAVKLGWA
jgi:hypothetical protein